jgi:hypothetical protein
MPLVNPPAAPLGRLNAIAGGRARSYEVAYPVVSLSEKTRIRFRRRIGKVAERPKSDPVRALASTPGEAFQIGSALFNQ